MIVTVFYQTFFRNSNLVDFSFHGSLQVRYSIWIDFWICTPCWDTFSWFCYHTWSCYYWASFVYFVVMDVSTSFGDSRGTLWLPFSLEPVKFVSVLWRVSWYALSRWSHIWKYLYFYTHPLLAKFIFLLHYNSADFHDYHHRLLYTKSGNYSSTFIYMDWWVICRICYLYFLDAYYGLIFIF